MLEHYGDTILNRIVAATAGAMQPCVRSLVGTSSHRLMADGANQDLEQRLRKNRRHSKSLDHHASLFAGRAGIYHEQEGWCMARVLDGNAIAAAIKAEVRDEV